MVEFSINYFFESFLIPFLPTHNFLKKYLIFYLNEFAKL